MISLLRAFGLAVCDNMSHTRKRFLAVQSAARNSLIFNEF